MLERGVEDGEDYGDSGRFHFVAFCRTGIKKPRGDESRGSTNQVYSGDDANVRYGGTEVEKYFRVCGQRAMWSTTDVSCFSIRATRYALRQTTTRTAD